MFNFKKVSLLSLVLFASHIVFPMHIEEQSSMHFGGQEEEANYDCFCEYLLQKLERAEELIKRKNFNQVRGELEAGFNERRVSEYLERYFKEKPGKGVDILGSVVKEMVLRDNDSKLQDGLVLIEYLRPKIKWDFSNKKAKRIASVVKEAKDKIKLGMFRDVQKILEDLAQELGGKHWIAIYINQNIEQDENANLIHAVIYSMGNKSRLNKAKRHIVSPKEATCALDLIRFLLQSGVNVNGRSMDKRRTPLLVFSRNLIATIVYYYSNPDPRRLFGKLLEKTLSLLLCYRADLSSEDSEYEKNIICWFLEDLNLSVNDEEEINRRRPFLQAKGKSFRGEDGGEEETFEAQDGYYYYVRKFADRFKNNFEDFIGALRDSRKKMLTIISSKEDIGEANKLPQALRDIRHRETECRNNCHKLIICEYCFGRPWCEYCQDGCYIGCWDCGGDHRVKGHGNCGSNRTCNSCNGTGIFRKCNRCDEGYACSTCRSYCLTCQKNQNNQNN